MSGLERSGGVYLGVLAITVACAAAAGTACSDDTSAVGPTIDGGSDAVPPSSDAAPADAGVAACTLERAGVVVGKVYHLDDANNQIAAPDVRVCIHSRPDLPCVTTGADGTYEHTCVPEGNTAISFTKAGYASTLWLRVITAGLGQTLQALVVHDADNAKLFSAVGATYPRAGYGLVTLNDTKDTDGIVVESLGAGTEGPFYSGSGVVIDRDAGGSLGDGVMFMIAPVGTLKLRLVSPDDAGTCKQDLGGWNSVDSTITVPVLENTETSILVRCK